jgi:hypothetical protein
MPERGHAPMAHTQRGDALACRQEGLERVSMCNICMSSEGNYACAITGLNRGGTLEPGSFLGVT